LAVSINISRIVITGVGLTAPNGNDLQEFRNSLLEGKSGISTIEIPYLGKVPAGICRFDENRYQPKKMRRRGTRAGAIGIYCANEALKAAKIDLAPMDRSRVGIFVGITEHGTVETEKEVSALIKNGGDVSLWSHHHNPRSVANNPAGEISLNLNITGPHYTLGAACAAGNVGLIQGLQMLQLGEVDIALAGGVSESTESFGIFASFKAQGALAETEDVTKACRPLDLDRKGIVVSEGGAIFVLERLEDALGRGANILGEIVGHHVNSDAVDFVLPEASAQIICMHKALAKAKMKAGEIGIVSLHATGTMQGDRAECEAVRAVFGENAENVHINGTKALIGHAMGGSGALELAGNLLSFEDGKVHAFYNVDRLDPECHLPQLVLGAPVDAKIDSILNNSFGMLGINSSVIVKKYTV
jgi:3-oxoacyl-[acyl-carrier-protein] synthase II